MITSYNIETEKNVRFETVISFRKHMRHNQVQEELNSFIQYLQFHGAKKKGPMITATHQVETKEGEQFIDFEFLIPIDKEIAITNDYLTFKPQFHLVNAVHVRYSEELGPIEHVYQSIADYIGKHRLHVITAYYNVNINDHMILHGEKPFIDIYVGVNPSSL